MITSERFKGKRYGVLGRGKAGRAAIASLKASGAELHVWDDSAYESGDVHFDEWPWKELDGIVLSPGIPYTHPSPHPVVRLAQQNKVEILGDVEMLYRARPDARYIGITGTNGKSTTTALIGHILQEAGMKVQVGGNLGVPALALEEADIYVLEMSSYQLDLVRSTHFDVAVWLNISPDHLDRHGDLQGYIKAKQHIFDRMDKTDLAVIGVDDAHSKEVAKHCPAQVMAISAQDKIGKKLADARALQGEHNHQNAAAAFAVCHALGVSEVVILDAMHSFPGLPHRMQFIAEIDGVTYINDSKATNAEAAEKSLRSFQNIYWLAGGVAKEGGIEMLRPYYPRIQKAYLFGQAKSAFALTLGKDLPHAQFETMDDAFAAAKQDAEGNRGVVLLAPACASFDQFSNFEERGEVFERLVKSE